MPLPLLFIGIAAVTGSVGAGKTVKAGLDAYTANRINKSANQIVTESTDMINAQRVSCSEALKSLGEEKVFLLNENMTQFLDTFTKIKNVDFRETEGLSELSKLHIDEKDFVELRDLCNFAIPLAGGGVAGTAGGALAAFGAYGAAQALACASTGTAIAALNGAAATNATLAFFGGGSLAAGGWGMAGGAMVLGGLVAGPALLVMGLVAGEAAKKNLDQARTNQAEAIQLAEQLDTASKQCEAIRRRTYMFYNLLARLDSYFLPCIYKMEDIVKREGYDYSCYTADSRKAIASCVSIAVSIKSVLDTQLLTDDGLLTDESAGVVVNTEEFVNKLVLAGDRNAVLQRSVSDERKTVLFDQSGKSKNVFGLKVKPEDYDDLNEPVPDEIPGPNIGCGIRTEMCQGLIFSWIVTSEQAMDYDDVEGTIAYIHQYLTEDSGIIECKNGITAKGHKYIYSIRKMRYSEEDMSLPEVSYTLNFNVNVDGTDYFINGSYVETGMTGMRDSVGFSMFQNTVKQEHPEKEYSTDDIMIMFFRDPYDENYKEGFLMNVSENEFFDEKFPAHPLSVLREYVRWVIDNN